MHAEKESLAYSIRPIVGTCGEAKLEITLSFVGNESGATEVILPSCWAGQNELYNEISEIHCSLPHAKIEDTDKPEIKKIYHSSGRSIQIIYQVTAGKRQAPEWYYRPCVESSYFFFFGHCFFIVPNIDQTKKIAISLEWVDISVDWSIANSFDVHKRKQTQVISIQTFLHAVYLAGDFRIIKCGQESAPVFIAIRENESLNDELFSHLIESIIMSQRAFWNDFDFPHYLISVLPTGDDNHMGGTGLSNAFSIFVGNLSNRNDKIWKILTTFLSHEHFHTWNGIKMRSAGPEGSLYWFTEGFTDYYAVKINYNAQLMNAREYIEYVNSVLYDYYTSSVHNEKNERILEDFWNNADVQKLPYVRGFLLALRWDKEIQEKSHKKYSLDNLMLALLKRTQENNSLFSQHDIQEEASVFLPRKMIEEDIIKYIINGESIQPKEEYFSETYCLTFTEDAGFDLLKSREEGTICGVNKRSAAFKAGLRDGQKFCNYTCEQQLISVTIFENENPEAITYSRSTSRLIPQYVKKHHI